MATVASHIDAVQLKLQDDGAIWSREELVRWFNDGLRMMMARTGARKVFTAMPIPPRHKFAYTNGWESQYADGAGRKFTYTHSRATLEATNLWEAESQEGFAATTLLNVSHLWELAYAETEVDAHYRFYLPHDATKILDVWYDHKHLESVVVRELDGLEDSWWRVQGEPYFWSYGLGRNKTFEVYEIKTGYADSYTKSNGPNGIIRRITGDREYSLFESGTLGLGMLRGIRSNDRQYWPRLERQGTLRGAVSSEGSILVHHVHSPSELAEESEVVGLPDRLEKRIRYHVLGMAFNRKGEGYNPNMAGHYDQRFQRAINLFRKLSSVTHRDKSFSRSSTGYARREVPRPQLPSNYPRAPWLA